MLSVEPYRLRWTNFAGNRKSVTHPGSARLKASRRPALRTQDSMQSLKTADFYVIGTLIEMIDSLEVVTTRWVLPVPARWTVPVPTRWTVRVLVHATGTALRVIERK